MKVFTFSSFFVCSLLWFVVLGDEPKTSAETDTPDCKMLYTFGYGYRQFLHLSESSLHSPLVGGDLLIKFMVRARSDAHVLLSPSPSPEDSEPVYEIVLGAGRNSFSDIRRRRRAATRASAMTKDILSPTDLRGFWIRINNQGLIQVGTDGDDVPFMYWQDTEPLPIRYFSFCTWSGVVGKWLYDCLETDDQDMLVQQNLTSVEKLRQHLLTNYDQYARPVSDPDVQLPIYVGLTAHHIQLDTKKSKMMVHGFLSMMWHDEKMHWDPTDYEDLTTLNLINHEIWQPEIVLYNAVGHGVSPLGTAGMVVTYDGKVMWRPPAHLESRCFQNLTFWPWDTQMCTLQFGFWSEQDSLQLILMENGTQLELHKTSSEWIVIKLGAETIKASTPWFGDSDGMSETLVNTALTFKFSLQRLSTIYCYVFILPLLGVVLLSLLTFWISPLRNEKLAIHCISLFLLSAFILKLEDILPATPDEIPYLMKAYSHVTIIVAVSTVISVFIINLTRNSHFKPPPKLICSLLQSWIATTMFCLPDLKSANTSMYGKLNENDGEVLTQHNEGDSYADQYWTLLAVIMDRITFIIIMFCFISVLMP